MSAGGLAEGNELTQQHLVDLHTQMLQLNSNLCLYDALTRSTSLRALQLETSLQSIQSSRRIGARVLCGILILASVLLFWTEVTLPSIVLDPFPLWMRASRAQHPLAVIVSASIIVVYASVCTVLGLFRWKRIPIWAPNVYMAPYQTDTASLLFCGVNCLRTATPLAYHAITILNVSSSSSLDDARTTTFEDVMGSMTLLPFVGGFRFPLFAPLIFLLPVSLLTLFHLYHRLAKCVLGIDELDKEILVQEGRMHVVRTQQQ